MYDSLFGTGQLDLDKYCMYFDLLHAGLSKLMNCRACRCCSMQAGGMRMRGRYGTPHCRQPCELRQGLGGA
jgi:hypothetical protein